MRNSSNFYLNSWTFPDCLVPVEISLVLTGVGISELCALPLLGLLMEGVVHCGTGPCLLQIGGSVIETGTERQQSFLTLGMPSVQLLLVSVVGHMK